MNWEKCPWRIQMTVNKLPYEDENECKLSRSECLKNSCPIVKQAARLEQQGKEIEALKEDLLDHMGQLGHTRVD